MVFPARWPEEVEEKRRAKDKCREDASEDVIASCADVVVIVDVRSVIKALDELLLVNIVWVEPLASISQRCVYGRRSLPDSAAVPSDSETTQNIIANWYTTNFVLRRW